MKEIERKFKIPLNQDVLSIISKFPNKSINIITQCYDNDGNRFRKTLDSSFNITYEKTVKIGIGLVREELTEIITADQYKESIKDIKYKMKKSRCNLKHDNYDISFDFDIHYRNYLQFNIIEIEFQNEKDAEEFKFEDFFKEIQYEEVTGNEDYSSINLIKRGYKC